MKKRLFIVLFIGFASASYAQPTEIEKEEQTIYKKLGRVPEVFAPFRSESMQPVILQKAELSADRKTLKLYCNVGLPQLSIRYERIRAWESEVRKRLGKEYKDMAVEFYAYDKIPIEAFIPNLYRPKDKRDDRRTSSPVNRRPLVRRVGQSVYGRGLTGRHIALWGGHGRLYHGEDSLWKWQRPPLFSTVEDLNTAEYVNRYLAPMLENAGAVVVMPRERDTQPREIIVDNDLSTGNARVELIGDWKQEAGGFKWVDTLQQENPFLQGSYLHTRMIEGGVRPQAIYHPNVAQPGRYGVYVSWRVMTGNLTGARYTVHHAGGATEFEVNQTIGGGMWVWLGSFDLDQNSRIILSAPEGIRSGNLTADAVKVGGGMGNVQRGYDADHMAVSGMPRYAEAMRYWMQYSGIPPSVYAQDTKGKDNEKDQKQLDYSDSFKATGDWCTYLKTDRQVPLDLAIGLHTDAGICDSIVGTLSIHFTRRTEAEYRNKKSKMAARDFADIVQTQIVDDIRAKYDPKWTRRAMYDKSYAEISRPDMPAMLIEMFSHQNANDMAVATNPEFRFDMSRAIYKGILRFLSDRYGTRYVVQPLAPRNLQAGFMPGDSIRISWRETVDPLEPTAKPNRYKIYRRIGTHGGFDNGTQVHGNEIVLPWIKNGQVYSYKITAINEGGESFPSETIAVGMATLEKGRALVVNGFTRLSGPAVVRDGKTGKALGFDLTADRGIPHIYDGSMVGTQYDFDTLSVFRNNEEPGWGASSYELLFQGVTGNTFDYAAKHGEALLKAGYSFVSCSREAFETMPFRPSQYQLVDVIMGEQKSYPAKYAVYTPAMIVQLQNAVGSGVKTVVSGSYAETDSSYTTEAAALFRNTGNGAAVGIGFPLERIETTELSEFFVRLLENR